MKLIAIAAVSMDGVIGIGDEIPWRISEDFKHFRNRTMGNTVIMGYNTFKTLPKRALEGRKYIVLSRTQYREDISIIDHDNVFVVNTVEKALGVAKELKSENVYIAGGSMIYDLFIEHCDEAVITWVHKIYPEGDKKFPYAKLLTGFDYTHETEWTASKEGYMYKITNYKSII